MAYDQSLLSFLFIFFHDSIIYNEQFLYKEGNSILSIIQDAIPIFSSLPLKSDESCKIYSVGVAALGEPSKLSQMLTSESFRGNKDCINV